MTLRDRPGRDGSLLVPYYLIIPFTTRFSNNNDVGSVSRKSGNLAMPGWRPYPKTMILTWTLAHKPVLLLKHYYQNLRLGLWIYYKHKIAFLGTVNTGTLLGPLVAIKSARTWRLEEMWPGILLTPTRAFLGRGRPGYVAKYPNVNSNCSNTRPTILHNHVTQKISQTKWSPYPPLALPEGLNGVNR